MCFSQQMTEQNRSFRRPVLHEATVQRTAEVPGGINLRQVAQTKLAMRLRSTRSHLYVYFRICWTAAAMSCSPRNTSRTVPAASITTVWGIGETP